VEAIPAREATDYVIIKFLEENILSRFGCPMNIITDNSQAFKSAKLLHFCQRYNIELVKSTAYYPQENGLAESSNKNIIKIIKKVFSKKKGLGFPPKVCSMGRSSKNQEVSWYISISTGIWA
jgi:transposase InsO family protein